MLEQFSREPAREMIYTPAAATPCGFEDDFPRLLREKPQRAKAISKMVTFEEWELPKFELPKFEHQSDYENTEPQCVGSQCPLTDIAPIEEETLTVMFNPNVAFGRAIPVEPKKGE